MIIKGIKNQQGVILLLSLVVMAVLLSAAITFAFFILSDLNQAKLVDSSVIAYYGAETGMEKSLFLLRKSDASTTDAIRRAISESNVNQILDNKAEWNISSSTDYESVFFRQRLANGQAAKIFFLNRIASGAQSIGVTWHMNSFTSAVDPKILIDFSQLAPQTVSDNNALVYLTDQSQYYNVAGADNGKPKCLLFRDQNVNTENYNKLLSRSDYAVNIKILNATSSVADNSDIVVDDLTVKAYDSNVCDSNGNVTTGSVSNSSAISNLTLRSDGFYNGTRQEIVAQIPPRDPVSGVLDFVLFSESDITKGY